MITFERFFPLASLGSKSTELLILLRQKSSFGFIFIPYWLAKPFHIPPFKCLSVTTFSLGPFELSHLIVCVVGEGVRFPGAVSCHPCTESRLVLLF